jgi:MYXO-CTERM domain-containing protein
VTKTLVSAMALAALAGMANAQTVEFRIVEEALTGNASTVVRTPPQQGTPLTSVNPLGNYAVQARVTGGANGIALGGFSFDIVIPGEADANGTIAKLRISNSDSSYFTGAPAVNGAVGSGGMAKQYTYLAGINGQFNGLVNASGGTFTNQAGQQEIGLITASATGSALLGVPGVDPQGESNVGTWSGYGAGATPPSGSTASLDPTIGPVYFAQGQFIDLYRFRYTTTNFANRTLNLTVANAAAQVFTNFVFNNGSWGPQATTLASTAITVTPLQVPVTPAPASAALLGLGGLVAARRRRVAK